MNIMHHEIGRDRYYKIWNMTNEAMIIYTYSEGGSIVFADKMFPIRKGTLCFIAPGIRHYTMPNAPHEYDRSKIFLSFDSVHQLLISMSTTNEMRKLFINNSIVYAHIPSEIGGKIEKIFADAEESRLKNECFEEVLTSSFLQLMILLKKHTVEHICSPDDFVSKAIEYINSSYNRKITLEDICLMVHVSKYHFCRSFKNIMGMTVMEYILETRIANAKNLLKSTDLRIEAVAEKCGFSSLSYFSQMFRQNVGMSPSQYQRK